GLARPRGFVFWRLPRPPMLPLSSHYFSRRWLHRRRARGRCSHRVLVVGSEHQVTDLVRHFRGASYAGFDVVGACVPGWIERLDIDGETVPVVGTPDAVLAALHGVSADTVAVADTEGLSNGA